MTIDVPIIFERGKRCRMYLYMCQEYKVKKGQVRDSRSREFKEQITNEKTTS